MMMVFVTTVVLLGKESRLLSDGYLGQAIGANQYIIFVPINSTRASDSTL